MDTNVNPEQIDLEYLLPRDAYRHLMYELHKSLPLTPNNTPEEESQRDHAAIAQVTCMIPANSTEATLAAQYVSANAQAMECQHLARDPKLTLEWVLKCHAQSASFMRQSQGALRLLLRVQAVREKREADNVRLNSANWTEHCAANLMAQVLPNAQPAAHTEPPPPTAPLTQAQPDPPPDEEPKFDPTAAAEEYAMLYPNRAALIRQHGGLPDNITFGPPERRLVRALLATHTPALLALDRECAEAQLA
jgi:hypothetical protein